MKKHDEAALAWRAWQVLRDLERLLWDRYRQQFLDFVVKDAQERNQQQPHTNNPPPG